VAAEPPPPAAAAAAVSDVSLASRSVTSPTTLQHDRLTDSGVVRIWCERRGTKLHETFCRTHEMTQDNTLNKVRVAATELQQLLSLNTSMSIESTAQSR